jgi:hypothetical protein
MEGKRLPAKTAIAAPAVTAIPAPAAAETAAPLIATEPTTAFAATLKLPRSPFLPGPRLVHGKAAVIHGESVELLHRCLCLGWRRHLHKGKPTRAAGELVKDQVDAGDGACLTEEVLEVLCSGSKG